MLLLLLLLPLPAQPPSNNRCERCDEDIEAESGGDNDGGGENGEHESGASGAGLDS